VLLQDAVGLVVRVAAQISGTGQPASTRRVTAVPRRSAKLTPSRPALAFALRNEEEIRCSRRGPRAMAAVAGEADRLLGQLERRHLGGPARLKLGVERRLERGR
jgi:hypothetical protein